MIEISENIRTDIDNAVLNYLKGSLTGNTYRFKGTNRYIKVNHITRSSTVIFNTKRDISLANYLFRISLFEYDNDVLECNVHLEKFMTLPELYIDSWVRCSETEYRNAVEEYNKIISKYGKSK